MALTIYKFDYKFYGSIYSLCFSLSDESVSQIDNWNLSLDKMVLDEQLKEGHFQGRFQIDTDLKRILEKMKEEGVIQPYYGAISPRACVYTLQVSPTKCKFEITHTVLEQAISIEEPVLIRRFELLGTVNNHKRSFMIKKQEYKALSKWKFWEPKEEFTPRYKYTFLPSSVGLVTTVLDVNSNEKIDITDYNDW